MIKLFSFLIIFIWANPCFARDFVVRFEEENYRETTASYSYFPVVYHSIQVSSDAGSKLLVLTGEDYHYRRWLRQYIAQGKAFIVKVSPEQTDQFVRASVFDIDVTQVHPFDLGLYKKGEEKSTQMRDLLPDINNTDKTSNALIMSPRSLPSKERSEKQKADPEKNKSTREASLKKQADLQKAKAEREKLKQAQEKDKAAVLEKQAQLQQLENERILKALADQKKIEEQRAQEQEALFKVLAEQRAQDEQQRRQELEQRYQELKQRLLRQERIRSMELDARNREIELRWQELRSSLGL